MCAGITANHNKKAYSCHYLDLEMSDLWEAIPEYSGAVTSFGEYRAVIVKLYPGSEIEKKWGFQVLMKLVKETVHTGIHTLGDFKEYHRPFLNVLCFFIMNHNLETKERSHILFKDSRQSFGSTCHTDLRLQSWPMYRVRITQLMKSLMQHTMFYLA